MPRAGVLSRVLWQPSASGVWWLSKMSVCVQACVCKRVCVCMCVCAHACCGLLGEEDLAFWVTKGSAGVSVGEGCWLGTEGIPCT